MTRKHYEAIAKMLGEFEHAMYLCRDDDTTITTSVGYFAAVFEQMVDKFAEMFEDNNERFDVARFKDAITEAAQKGESK